MNFPAFQTNIRCIMNILISTHITKTTSLIITMLAQVSYQELYLSIVSFPDNDFRLKMMWTF